MSTNKASSLESRVALLERFIRRIYDQNPDLKFPDTAELSDMTFAAMDDAKTGNSTLFRFAVKQINLNDQGTQGSDSD